MRTPLFRDLAPLALILAAALAGHLLLAPLVAPLLAPLRATLGGYRAPAARVEPALRVMLLPDPPLGGGAAPFHASSLESGFSWSGEFQGRVAWEPEGLRAVIASARIHRSLQAGGRLRSVRLDLARGRREASWAVVREGVPVALAPSLEPGETAEVGPLELLLPGVEPDELQGGWLVVVLELRTESGGLGWTYAHTEPAFSSELAPWAWDSDGRRP